ncbi:Aurora/IPL1-related protein kinase 2 [Colletotrichum fructicola]|nr:Aurora/IPL1-related protein kinase 2 [Colletotrichum fructicola]KAF4912071.1 Aurora/IPL1-related protein kinase 2 [Colletotrichum fructicola]KAF4939332.1 Aurora/IPL1-related protein kinase 2 [Colletotrichum fructicola]
MTGNESGRRRTKRTKSNPRLSDDIMAHYRRSAFEKSTSSFLPEGDIAGLVTDKTVMKALGWKRQRPRECPKSQDMLRFILEEARKTFAITSLTGLTGKELLEAMGILKDASISDSCLPVKKILWEEKGIIRRPNFGGTNENADINNGSDDREKLSDSDDDSSDSEDSSEDEQDFHCPQYVAVKEIQASTQKERSKIVSNWEKEAGVLQKMNQLNQPHIVRFLTAFRWGDQGEEDHYLMLEWADGGNLRNLWERFERPSLTPGLIQDTVQQLLGLANALSKAHYPETGPNFRHGDLKPENILWFKSKSGNGIGTLKIGDWGLAKQHLVVTELRSNQTTTQWGTRRYEPPEEAPGEGSNLLLPNQPGKKRSRLYDIWALGCISLEFLIWLMYGRDELNQFNKSLGTNSLDIPRFYQLKQNQNGRSKAQVHDVVEKWMDHMARDKICRPGSTALGSLLELIRTRLLVVKLPERLATSPDLSKATGTLKSDTTSNVPGSPHIKESIDFPNTESIPGIAIFEPEANESPIPPRIDTGSHRKVGASTGKVWERARATDVQDQMQIIAGEDEDDSYWFTDQPSPPYGPGYAEVPQTIKSANGQIGGKTVSEGMRAEVQRLSLHPRAQGLSAQATQLVI